MTKMQVVAGVVGLLVTLCGLYGLFNARKINARDMMRHEPGSWSYRILASPYRLGGLRLAAAIAVVVGVVVLYGAMTGGR